VTPGTILFDPNFQFKDGQLGEKLYVVLNDGSCGIYIGVKTTSNGNRHGIQHGCQVLERFPNFMLAKGCCCLSKTTWVQLDAFFEFQSGALIEKVMTGQINRIGTLSDDLTRELLTCTTHAEDMTISQDEIIQAAVAAYLPTNETSD